MEINAEQNQRLVELFLDKFGGNTTPRVFTAPGRVNLIGEHTDYNGGVVLPFAIDKFTRVGVRKRKDDNVFVYSQNKDETWTADTCNMGQKRKDDWTDYIEGVITELAKTGSQIGGFEACVSTEIPIGAGLSSSAALEISVGVALDRLFDLKKTGTELIKACQRAENDFVGANTGIMDQFVSYFGKRDKAILLDTTTLDYEYIDFEAKEFSILVVDTRISHAFSDGGYNERRRECERALELVNSIPDFQTLSNLSELEVEDLPPLKANLPSRLMNRARHVVEENSRVRKTVGALKEHDLDSVGRLLFQAHKSMKQLYEASVEEADFLVETAQKLGAIGARITGGGFGGSTIHLLMNGNVSNYTGEIRQRYERRFGFPPDVFLVSPGDGAKFCNSDS